MSQNYKLEATYIYVKKFCEEVYFIIKTTYKEAGTCIQEVCIGYQTQRD